MASKLAGEAVERRFDKRVGGTRRHVASRAGGEHVARDRIVRLVRQPLLEHLDRLVDVAERAVRKRQQPARLWMLRPQRDHLREADRRFVRALLAVQQHAEIVVGVRVLGVDADRVPVRRFRFGRLAFRPEHDAEVVVRVGVARLQRDRAAVGGDRVVELDRS